MKFLMPNANNHALWKVGPKKPPMRTFKEMAEEFGVTSATLNALVNHHQGPKSVKKGSHEAKTVWCDAQAMRTWWKSLGARE